MWSGLLDIYSLSSTPLHRLMRKIIATAFVLVAATVGAQAQAETEGRLVPNGTTAGTFVAMETNSAFTDRCG